MYVTRVWLRVDMLVSRVVAQCIKQHCIHFWSWTLSFLLKQLIEHCWYCLWESPITISVASVFLKKKKHLWSPSPTKAKQKYILRAYSIRLDMVRVKTQHSFMLRWTPRLPSTARSAQRKHQQRPSGDLSEGPTFPTEQLQQEANRMNDFTCFLFYWKQSERHVLMSMAYSKYMCNNHEYQKTNVYIHIWIQDILPWDSICMRGSELLEVQCKHI